MQFGTGAKEPVCRGRNIADPLVRSESPAEYFKELVETAVEHQHLAVRDLTSFYLVNLLTGFVHHDRPSSMEEPLGIRFARALQAGGSRQRDGLREVGDLSLFISGFFADSLTRAYDDIDYTSSWAKTRTHSLACCERALGDVFDELAAKFTGCVEVLAEVSERSALTSNTDVLRLYERWMRTRSRRSEELLAEKGIVKNYAVGSRIIQ